MPLQTLTTLISKPRAAFSTQLSPSASPSYRRLCGFITAFGAAASLLVSVTAALAHPMTRHEARIAARQAHQGATQARLATQHRALTSGNVVMAAYAFRGTRYVMGGTSRSGFDCSGFVRYILGNAGGVSLPRTAADQFYHGQPIALKDMQPGDLVFFKNTYKRGISHVGIYAGNGQFIHAANPRRGVQMDSLSGSYFAHHFAGARRVLPAEMRAMASLR